MARYVIHVGPHKTGTSYLQMAFDQQRNSLMERGVAYPTVWYHSAGNPSHAQLAQLLSAKDYSRIERQLREITSQQCETVLISAEDIVDSTEESLDCLNQILSSNDVQIVFYCRSWAELLYSCWQEDVKHGRTETLPEMVFEHLRDPFASYIVNFSRKLEKFERVFGVQALRLVSFSSVIGSGQDLFGHFAHTFLDWSPTNKLAIGLPNQAVSPTDIELIRALNAIEWNTTKQRNARLRNLYLLAKPTMDLARLWEVAKRETRRLKIDDASPGLKSLHESLFARYKANLVPPLLPDRLFRPVWKEFMYVGTDYLLWEGVREDLYAIYKKLSSL